MKAIFQEKYDNIFMAILLMMALIICTLSYMPSLTGVYAFMNETSDDRLYFSLVVLGITIIMGIVNISALMDSLIKLRINQIAILFYAVSLIISISEFMLFLGNIYVLGSALMAFVVGTAFAFRPYQIKIILYGYAIVSMVVGIYMIISYGGSLEIIDSYLFSHKNAVCVTWAICSVILVYFAFSESFGISTVLNIGGAIIFIIMISVSRGRAALLASILCIAFLFIRKFFNVGRKNLINITVFTFITAIVLGLLVLKFDAFSFIKQAFLGVNKEYADIDALSSGRITLLKMGIEEFISNPVFGGLYRNEDFGMVHNYPVRILASYGLLGGGGFIIIYLLFMVRVLKGMFSMQIFGKYEIWRVGYFIMAVLYIVSMFEPIAPFGPGTISFVGFFMFGVAIRCEAMGLNDRGNMPAFSPIPPRIPGTMLRNGEISA